MSEGFRQRRGFRVLAANEMDDRIAQTYQANHPKTRLIVGDITKPQVRDSIFQAFPGEPCHVVLGGVPCQPWSRCGNRLGFADPRGRLWFDYIETVHRLGPLVFVAENVAGLLDHTDALDRLLHEFEDIHYHVEHRILNSADFGAPQTRRRLILFGTRKDHWDQPILWPSPTHCEDPTASGQRILPAWRTVGEALAPYADIAEDYALRHVFARSKPQTLERIRNTPIGHSLYEYKDAWLRLDPTKPAPTVKGNNGGVFVHPFHDRTVSPRELAALQGFNDQYIFCGTKSSVWVQIGNAVPPPLARALAGSVGKMLAR